MLLFPREYTDGKFVYMIIPVENMNIVKLFDKIEKKLLKEYETEDDEAALYIFQSMIDTQERFGYPDLLNFKMKEQLPMNLFLNVHILVEDTPVENYEC
jgi:hypothetical protein